MSNGIEMRFNANADIVERIRDHTQIINNAEIGRQSIAVFEWVAAQAAAGNQVVSIDSSGNQVRYPFDTITSVSRW